MKGTQNLCHNTLHLALLLRTDLMSTVPKMNKPNRSNILLYRRFQLIYNLNSFYTFKSSLQDCYMYLSRSIQTDIRSYSCKRPLSSFCLRCTPMGQHSILIHLSFQSSKKNQHHQYILHQNSHCQFDSVSLASLLDFHLTYHSKLGDIIMIYRVHLFTDNLMPMKWPSKYSTFKMVNIIIIIYFILSVLCY